MSRMWQAVAALVVVQTAALAALAQLAVGHLS